MNFKNCARMAKANISHIVILYILLLYYIYLKKYKIDRVHKRI